MSTTARDTGSHRALLPYEVENEQRYKYDWRVAAWPIRLAGILVGLMWLTQLVPQLPWNNFVPAGSPPNGVQANTQVTPTQPGPYVDNGRGLYHLLTQMAIYGSEGRAPFYGNFVKNTLLPNWRFVGWLAFVIGSVAATTLILGLLSRIGGFFTLLQGVNLYLGLSKVPDQWEWTYALVAILGFILTFCGSGRFLGLDQLLRPKLREMIGSEKQAAKYLYVLT